MKCPNCGCGISKGFFYHADILIEQSWRCRGVCGFSFVMVFPDYLTYVECRDRSRVMRSTGRVI